MAELSMDRLTEYVLGTLSDAERIEVEDQLAQSSEAQRDVLVIREVLGGGLMEHDVAASPSTAGRHALLDALNSGARYRPFLADLMRHFDLPSQRVAELFNEIDVPASWEAGPMPGIFVMHFAGGPQALAHDTGFVRLPRGLQFPYHRHLGHEINYVIEGALRDGDGKLYLPGEAIERAQGTAHEFSVPEDADALIAVVQDGFEFINKE